METKNKAFDPPGVRLSLPRIFVFCYTVCVFTVHLNREGMLNRWRATHSPSPPLSLQDGYLGRLRLGICLCLSFSLELDLDVLCLCLGPDT